MQHIRLGATGLQVSRICLGTMTFGGQSDEATSRAILNRAAEAGVTFVDTANGYPSLRGLDDVGGSEEIIGRWMKGRRADVVVATKCFAAFGPLPFQRGTSRKAIFDAVEGSLRRLQTDYIDLYQLHHPDPDTPVEESLDALNDLVRAGTIRYAACSNYPAYRVGLSLGRSEARNRTKLVSIQSRYNLLYRELERDVLPLCLEEGLGFLPFSPLAGGMLTGKHRRDAPPDPTMRFGVPGMMGEISRSRHWNDTTFDAVDALAQVADETGMSLPTLAIAWLLAQPAVTSPIIGATRPEHLDAAFAATDVTLDDAVLGRLDELTAVFR